MPRGGRPPRRGWEDKFFEKFNETKLLGEACKACGISRSFLHSQRKTNPVFAARFEDEMEKQTEILEQIAVRRAAEGSDTLMIFLLKSRRPDVYRDNIHHDHQHQVSGAIGLNLLDGANPVEYTGEARREAAALLMAGVKQLEQQEKDVPEETDPGVIDGEFVEEFPEEAEQDQDQETEAA